MMCLSFVFLVLTCAVGVTDAAHDLQKHMRTNGFLASDLRPDLVARTLVDVVNGWKVEASSFMECNATDNGVNCASTPDAFQKSCGTVTMSIVSASSGDRDVVKEYLADVCSQKVLDNWHHERCLELKDDVEKAMSDNNYANRENFDAQKMCGVFWSNFVEKERARMEKEAAERAEAEKKAADEKAAAQKKAEEEAKRKAEKEAMEAKQKAETEAKEAKRKAEEEAKEATVRAAKLAKEQVEEASVKLAAKKAEAEEMARAAKMKLEEAQKAEQEHHELLSKANSTTAIAFSPKVVQKANATQAEDLEALKKQARSTLDKAASAAADATKVQVESNKTVANASSSTPLVSAEPGKSTVRNSSETQLANKTK